MKKFLRVSVFILLILWMTLIFSLSNETATESSDTSGGFSYKVVAFFYPEFKALSETEQQEIISTLSFPIRKGAHFTLFSVLGALSYANVSFFKGINRNKKNIIAFAFSASYAATDELHQYFIEGRSCELRDWLIDCSGVLLAIILINILFIKRRKGKMRKKELLDKNQTMLEDLEKQKNENEDLKTKLEEQGKLISSLNERISDLQNLLNENSAKEIEETEETLENVEEKEENIMDYGAVIIGKVVLSAAEYSSRAGEEEQETIREAILSILERAEETKKEILNIISSDYSIDSKKQLMEREYQSAVSYFDRTVSRI